MPRRRLVLLLALAACGADQDPTLDLGAAPSSTAPAETTFDVTLTRAGEVPGPGAPDGAGSAEIRLVPARSEVCYRIELEGLDDATGAHVHRAPAGQAGDVVLDLSRPAEGPWDDCSAADEALVEAIAADPAGYYVNVRTALHPKGAVRGQLA